MQYRSYSAPLRQLMANKKVRFVAAGILNTGIDFLIFNLAIFAFGLRPWVANLCSTTIAMALSYFINKELVFQDRKAMSHTQFLAFIAVTAIGLWGLQTAIVISVSAVFQSTAPLQLFGIHRHVAADNWLVANFAKAVATVASAIWNYFWYDRVIFVNKKVIPQEWL